MLDDPEPPGPAHSPVHGTQGPLLEGASLQVLDPAAVLTDQMVVMGGERVGKLEPLLAADGVDHAQHLEAQEYMDGPVDGREIDPAVLQSAVDRGGGEGGAARHEHVEDLTPGRRRAVAAVGKECGHGVAKITLIHIANALQRKGPEPACQRDGTAASDVRCAAANSWKLPG